MKMRIRTAILCVFLCLALTACAEPRTPFEEVCASLEEISAAETIEQSVEVACDTLKVYSAERNFRRSGENFLVREQTEKLNPVGEETPYMRTEREYQRTAGETFVSRFRLEEDDLSQSTFTGDAFFAVLKEGRAEKVFGLGASAAIENVRISLSLADGRAERLEICFSSGEYEAQIVLVFGYGG